MILSGQVDDGIHALDSLLLDSPGMHADQIDRLIQVLFDLQTVGRHKEAIKLFKNIPLQGQSGQLRREILYWIADSYKELKQHDQAARLSGSRYQKLKNLKNPVFILHGIKDPLVSIEHSKKLASVIPHSKTRWYENMGHFLPLYLIGSISEEIILNMAQNK